MENENKEVLQEEVTTEEIKVEENKAEGVTTEESKVEQTPEEETGEFDTFTINLNGVTREWAITDEFDFEAKHYLICAEVVGDNLSDAGLYIFEGKSDGDDLEVKNLETEEEYIRVAEAYCKENEEAAE